MNSPSEYQFKVIAKIKSDFPDKFGIPRQSGLLKGLRSAIRFEKPYCVSDALRGLEGFSHLWILWIFSENVREEWSPTVRPPRLGGNKRLGVFATRSSFRPNPLAMSCVKIEEIRPNITDGDYSGPEIIVSGADLMDGTPIVDIKPYLPYADAIPDALGGFAHEVKDKCLQVDFPEKLLEELREQYFFTEEKIEALIEILAENPIPAYQKNPNRIYGFKFAGVDIKFNIKNEVLTVLRITPLQK